MRTLIFILLTIVTLSVAKAAPPIVPDPAESAIQVTTTSYKNIFVLIVNKKFMGAHMEVLSTSGDCITCQNVTRRKMTLDLRDAQPGTYVVQVKKEGIIERLQFQKR